MKTESAEHRCPNCGAAIAADAPQNLCPRCVLAAAATVSESATEPRSRLVPPSVEAVQAAFPQLEILELIGAGGMGAVYKARQPKLDRVVALKLLPEASAASPAFAERFNREARVLARLNHPNIVTVYDFGRSGPFYFLLMEFVDGANLRQAMRAGRFLPAEALKIVPRICEALQYAHEEGVLHRDIKPENILLDTRGRVKIADFGIAKLVAENPGDITLTASGAALGTPHYMAPEQIEKPSEVDHRADIYSLGVVFYEMLTGELPLGRFAPPSSKATLDARVDEIVFRALAKERELRQQSAAEVKAEVETVATTPSAVAPVSASKGTPAPTGPAPLSEGVALRAHPGAAIGALAIFVVGTVAIPSLAVRLVPGSLNQLVELVRGNPLAVVFVALLVVVLWAPVALAMVWLMNRGESRRNFGRDIRELASMPDWASRCAWFFAAAAALGVGGTAWAFVMSPANTVVWSLDMGILSALTAYAIWKRNATARLAALMAAAGALLILVAGFVFSVGLYLGGAPFLAPPLSQRIPGLVWLASLLAWPLGVAVLLHPEVRRAFGILPRRDGTDGADAIQAPRGWSWKAVIGALLVAASLPVLLLLFVATFRFRTGGVGPGEFWLVVGVLTLFGLPGTILGWMGLSDLRESRGTLRGVPLAVFAALTLPLLCLLLPSLLGPWLAVVATANTLAPDTAIFRLWLVRMSVVLLPAGVVTFAIWSIYATSRWAAQRPVLRRRGVLKWVFLGLLICGGGLVLSAGRGSGRILREPVVVGSSASPAEPATRIDFEMAPATGEAAGSEPATAVTLPAADLPSKAPPSSPLPPRPLVTDVPGRETDEQHEIRIRLARERLAEVRQRHDTGQATSLDLARAERDVAVAEARGEAVPMAEANFRIAQLEFLEAGKRFQVGAIPSIDLKSAEAERDLKRIDFENALKSLFIPVPGEAERVRAQAQAPDRLAEARRRLQAVEEQVATGQLPPIGREMLEAREGVALAEAQGRGDALGALRVRLDFAGRRVALLTKLHEVGKATAKEVVDAVVREIQARAAVSMAERQGVGGPPAP